MRRVVLSLLICLFGLPTWAADVRIALVIGNSNYVEFGSLSNPKNDAQGIDRALRASPAVRGRATARHCCFASVLRSSGLTHDIFIDQKPVRKKDFSKWKQKTFPDGAQRY